MTSNNLPRFHKLDDRVITICGYNGRGISPGTVFGQLLAAYVAGEIGDADMPLPVSDPQPVSALPLREGWYEAGAQLVHLTQARF